MPLYTLANLTTATTTAGTNGTAQFIGGYWDRAVIVLDHTASGVDAPDTLDVYVDLSLDGTIWVNAVHFASKAGNAAASSEFAILDHAIPGTATIVSTSDAAVSTVRPYVFGLQIRARYVIVNGAGGNAPDHDFSVKAYVQ